MADEPSLLCKSLKKASLADCDAFDKVLGEKDAPKFKGTCLQGSKTPVLKKVPAFLLFLAFYLAIVICMAKALSSSSTSVQVKFTDIGDGFWRGNDLDDWFPNASLVERDVNLTYCRGRCLNNTNCKGFKIMKADSVFLVAPYDNCYISNTTFIPAATKCINECNSYVRSLDDPTPNTQQAQQTATADFSSPLAPENLECSQPLSFGLYLCIIVSSVVFVVYWPFFTLPVPARTWFRSVFFATMFGSMVCGIVVASWISKEDVCTVPLLSFDDPRTPAQKALASAARAAAACLILMGAWPALLSLWVPVCALQMPLLMLYAAVTNTPRDKLTDYWFTLKWLIWQDYEYGGAPSAAAGHVHPTTSPTAQPNKATTPQDKITELERAIAQEKATSAGLRQEMAAMSMDVMPTAYPSPGFNAVAPPVGVPGGVPPPSQAYTGVPAPLDHSAYHSNPQYNPANPPPYASSNSPYNGNPSPYSPSPYDNHQPAPFNHSPYNNGNLYPAPVVGAPNYPSYADNNNNNGGGDYGPHNNYGDNNNGQPVAFASSSSSPPPPPSATEPTKSTDMAYPSYSDYPSSSSSSSSSPDATATPAESSSYVPSYY